MSARGFNQKEEAVLKNMVRRLSKMRRSPNIWSGRTHVLKFAQLLIEDALTDHTRDRPSSFRVLHQAAASETALKWEEAEELRNELIDRLAILDDLIDKGAY